jgi:hypothetical protein
MRLFQPLGIEAEFLGHLDKFLRGFRVLDGAGQTFGSDGLVAVVIGLGHGSTFLDRYYLRKKGSMTVIKMMAGKAGSVLAAKLAVARNTRSNSILSRRQSWKVRPLFVPREQKESRSAAPHR